MTTQFAINYLLDDCKNCPENKDGECMKQSHCFEVKQMAIKAIKQLPGTEKTGHWILSVEDWNKWTCSKCGYYERTDIHVSLGYNYCPKCGIRMAESEEI